MTTGTELNTFITGLNGGASIDSSLLNVLVPVAQTILENERPWMVLRKTDSSLSATTGGTWQTAYSLANITGFNRFYGETSVRLFDGTNRIEYYRQVPFDRRLEYKDVSNTFVYDANSKTMYLNGTVPFNGTPYINYVLASTAVDITSDSAVWSVFPSIYLPILGFYAVGIHKGAVDYDDINKLMLPSNQLVLSQLKNAMEKWDNDLQLSSIEFNDPGELSSGPRSGAVDIYDER